MAQRITQDPYAEFGEPVDDPFAEFGEPVEVDLTPVVTPEPPKISQPDPVAEARQFLTASGGGSPVVESQTLDQTPVKESSLLDRLVSPLWEAPAAFGRKVADKLSSPNLDDSVPYAMAKGALGGVAEGIGNVISSATSPVDLAAAALTGGAGLAGMGGRTGVQNALRGAGRAFSLPVMAHGGSEVAEGVRTGDIPRIGTGLLETAGGTLGAFGGLKTSDIVPSQKTQLETPILPANKLEPNLPSQPPVQKIKLKVDSSGQYNLEDPVTKAVVEYQQSKGKNITKVSPSETLVMPKKPVPTGDKIVDETTWRDYLSVPRAIQSAYDLSFPFRQGLGLIHTQGWWKAWPDMVKSVGSEEAYKSVVDSIAQRPNFQVRPDGRSFAQDAGLAITDLGNLAKREEDLGSKIVEKIPGLRASNRAYTAFANKLRADNFDALIQQAESAGLNPKQNLPLAKEIASFVNNASGRGNLGSLESSAVALNNLLFSPRLMASRLQMLNPANYAMGNPFVRKQYLKSALALGVTWNAIAELSKLGGAEVSNDPKASDFRQIKIGDTRIDPSGGLRPYIVLGSRLSEMFQKNRDRYTGKYGARNPIQDVVEFLENKMAPNAAFATGLARGDEKFPFYVGDEIAKMFTPIMIQDILELYHEDPSLLPIAGLAGIGMGTNTFQKGRQEEPRMTEPIFPKQYDLRFPRR